jgi:hypothetical protein
VLDAFGNQWWLFTCVEDVSFPQLVRRPKPDPAVQRLEKLVGTWDINRERNKVMTSAGQVQYINPDALNKNPAFTNVIVVAGSVKTVYVGGL